MGAQKRRWNLRRMRWMVRRIPLRVLWEETPMSTINLLRSRRPSAGLLLASVLFASVSSVRADTVTIPETRCGDVNFSRTLTAPDALAVLRQSVGQDVETACVSTPMVVTYGTTTDIPETSYFENNFLLGTRVAVTDSITVTSLGLVTREQGPHVKMGLYSDNGGQPDSLIIATEAAEVGLGAQSIPVTPTVILAGNYWLMAVYDDDTDTPANDASTINTIRYRAHNFPDPLPATFGPSSSYPGSPLLYTVRGLP
jgi:hypothetical protein